MEYREEFGFSWAYPDCSGPDLLKQPNWLAPREKLGRCERDQPPAAFLIPPGELESHSAK